MHDDQMTPAEPKPIIRLKESVINKIAAGEVPFCPRTLLRSGTQFLE